MRTINPTFTRRWPPPRAQSMAAFGVFGSLRRWPPAPKMATEDGHWQSSINYIYIKYLYRRRPSARRYRNMAAFDMEITA